MQPMGSSNNPRIRSAVLHDRSTLHRLTQSAPPVGHIYHSKLERTSHRASLSLEARYRARGVRAAPCRHRSPPTTPHRLTQSAPVSRVASRPCSPSSGSAAAAQQAFHSRSLRQAWGDSERPISPVRRHSTRLRMLDSVIDHAATVLSRVSALGQAKQDRSTDRGSPLRDLLTASPRINSTSEPPAYRNAPQKACSVSREGYLTRPASPM